MRIKFTPVSMMSLMLAAVAVAACFQLSNTFAADATAPAAATTAKAVTYTVNLSPPNKVGQKATVVVDLEYKLVNHVAITSPNSPPQNQDSNTETKAHLEGEEEVLAVYPNGGIQKAALILKAFTATTNGRAMMGLPEAGAKIVADKSGKTTAYTVDGHPAGAPGVVLLQMILPMDDGKYTDQEKFGPQNPVAVGATWPVNSANMMDDFKDKPDGPVSGVNGTMKLDGITGTGADQVATISGNITVEGVQPSLPPGATIDTSVVASALSGSVPATTTQGTAKKTMTTSGKIAAHGDTGGTSFKYNSTADKKQTETITYHQ
ncbi:MAG TPA: hypothetical protein VK737_06200 [Opitutales bacterium]|jgi:hypothetical protein|nr:hypothetical protein [Opitutales bacterium]